MVLVDRRFLLGGLAVLAAGAAASAYLGLSMPVGTAGMGDEEALQLIQAQRENRDLASLAGITMGVGMLLALVSFGARRRRGAGAARSERKPAARL